MLALTLDQNVWWYTARASGMVAWLLVAASVCWGLVVSGRLTRRVPPPAWNLDLHRFLGALSVIFTAVHITGLAADKYVHFGWSELFVPLASRWRPLAVAWGISALYLLAAVEVTSLVMRWLPRRLWRFIHAGAFVLFIAATGHAVQAGTDARQPIVARVGISVAALALCVGVARVWLAGRRQRRRAQTAPRLASGPATAAEPALVEDVA